MILTIERPDNTITIVPDNIVCINKYHKTSSPYKWALVGTSGDILYITDEEKLIVDNALRLRDIQMTTLIDNTYSIINELDELNGTTHNIDGTTNVIKNHANDIKNSNSQILTETRENGNLLERIRQTCNDILNWLRNHNWNNGNKPA